MTAFLAKIPNDSMQTLSPTARWSGCELAVEEGGLGEPGPLHLSNVIMRFSTVAAL